MIWNDIFPQDQLNEEVKNEMARIREIEKIVKKNSIFETSKYIYIWYIYIYYIYTIYVTYIYACIYRYIQIYRYRYIASINLK